jgi:hypothetical protein
MGPLMDAYRDGDYEEALRIIEAAKNKSLEGLLIYIFAVPCCTISESFRKLRQAFANAFPCRNTNS